MVTLALAQMVYFVFLQAPFTHGEDGMQGVPRGKLFGVIDLEFRPDALLRRAAGDGAGVRVDRADRAFAVRAGADRDQGKRAARDLARLRHDRFKLLAFVLSAGLAGLAGSLKTLVLGFETLGDAYWTMSGLVDPDDAGGRHGHACSGRCSARRLSSRWKTGSAISAPRWRRLTGVDWFNSLGESVTIVTGADLYRVRAGVPAGDCRRNHRAGEAVARLIDIVKSRNLFGDPTIISGCAVSDYSNADKSSHKRAPN